jgi:hypothetical protein
MIKKNVISGLLLFSISVLLGPYMMEVVSKDVLTPITTQNYRIVGGINKALAAYEEIEDPLALAASSDEIGVEAGKAAVASLKLKEAEWQWGNVVFSHAHGNLEGLLNIAAGLVLAQLIIPALFREVISWLLILGSWGHAGLFIVANIWFPQLLSYWIYGGALLILGLWALTIAVILHIRTSAKEAGQGTRPFAGA